MRSRAGLFKALPIALALALIPVVAFSAQKILPGSVCKVYQQKAMYQSKSYTCIKSGKKLVWNKGVGVVNPSPTATPTSSPTATPTSSPTATPTPSPSPTVKAVTVPKDGDVPLPSENCSSGNYYYRIDNGVTERSFYFDKDYTSVDSRSDALFDPIRVKAYRAIRDHVPSSKITPPVDFHVSSDFPAVHLAPLKTQLAYTVPYWADFFPSQTRVQATFLTEKDSALISANDISRPDDAQWVMDTYNNSTLDAWNNPKNLGYLNCGWRYGVSGSHILGKGTNRGQIGFWIISPTTNAGKYWDPTYLTHEFTHGVQDLIWFKNDINVMENGAPYFLIEGAGQLFGAALGLPNLGWFQDDLYQQIDENYIGGPMLGRKLPTSTEDILGMIKSAEKNDGEAGTVWAYTVGSQVWEWVIANYGFDAYWDIVKGISKTQNYDATVLKVIGKSKENLYKEAAPYILKSFEAALAGKK